MSAVFHLSVSFFFFNLLDTLFGGVVLVLSNVVEVRDVVKVVGALGTVVSDFMSSVVVVRANVCKLVIPVNPSPNSFVC